MSRVRLVVLAVLALALSAGADVYVQTVLFGGSGDLMIGASGAVVPLSSSSLLVPAEGPDGARGTDDDVVLFVHHSGGPWSVTVLPAPYQAKQSGGTGSPSGSRLVRLSATRAVMATAGPDMTWNTADDQDWFLTDLGGTNDCYPAGVPHMLPGACSPVPLTDRFFLQVTTGPDGLASTADDLLTRSYFGPGYISRFDYPAPHLTEAGGNRPVVLSPDACLVISAGPDGQSETADDLVYVFRNLRDGPARTDIPTPYLRYGTSSQPVRIDEDRALVTHCGPDGSPVTADDGVYYLTGLASGGTPGVTDVSVPGIPEYAAGQPVVVNGNLAVVPTAGPDGVVRTADDTLALLTGFNAVTQVTVGPVDEDGQSRPTVLSPTRLVLPSAAAAPDFPVSRLMILSDLGGMNYVDHLDLPGLPEGVTGTVLRLTATAVVVTNFGPDGKSGGDDDRVSLATDLDGIPTIFHTPAGGNLDNEYHLGYAPVGLGEGHAAFVTGGPDGVGHEGDDAVLRILGELPEGSRLVVSKMKTSFSAAKPEKGAKLSLSGTFLPDSSEPFGSGGLRISLGAICETIPANLLVQKGSKWSYKRPKDGTGFVTKLSWDSAKGKLKISGAGVDSGIETTTPTCFPVAFEYATTYVGRTLSATASDKGLAYTAPN
ncbi:MAG: hypothetical protein MUE73_03660 [Planctomycetes bacterium]|jgi:hypothetical protein|nr:hypothetical protein [Planctomycetota bacterium]